MRELRSGPSLFARARTTTAPSFGPWVTNWTMPGLLYQWRTPHRRRMQREARLADPARVPYFLVDDQTCAG